MTFGILLIMGKMFISVKSRCIFIKVTPSFDRKLALVCNYIEFTLYFQFFRRISQFFKPFAFGFYCYLRLACRCQFLKDFFFLWNVYKFCILGLIIIRKDEEESSTCYQSAKAYGQIERWYFPPIKHYKTDRLLCKFLSVY